MAVRGWNCERCGVFTQALFFWPNPANPSKNVCRRCYALLWAATQWQQTASNNTAGAASQWQQTASTTGCRLQQQPPVPADKRPTQRHLMPAGSEYRFLFALWWAHRGLTEPLRNRIVLAEGVTVP